ncbi:C40 family peptidase [Zwartia vadi]|uniref:C40 family peptidase n=1 Tax=Zwartia vadi TaxID=3058168 RepID=UPI0025B5CE3A|nr:C40 family peptidase [Zwartia vadi]MDN3987136.1 C40 family peptidase [Zwartia vadi]
MTFQTTVTSTISIATQMLQSTRMVFVCLGAAVLVGCAGQDGSGGKRAGYDWRNAADPIGAFAAGPRYVAGLGLIDHPLANQALNQLGINYRWGGKSPDTGFDCSGLVVYSAQRSLGLKLPPRADDIAKFGDKVNKKDLQVGDLVFFNTLGTRYSHVGVYLGQNKFVHAPTRGSVVRVEDMTLRYWTARYTGARRLDPTLIASR